MIKEKHSFNFFSSFSSNMISSQWALCLPLSVWLTPRAFSWETVLQQMEMRQLTVPSAHIQMTVLFFLKSLPTLIFTPTE